MKLCMVYSPRDSKLRDNAYCSIFKDMFFALIDRFDCKSFRTDDCNAKDIDADVIFFFDPHATHQIKIDGIKEHPAVKIEYWNDPHQKEQKLMDLTTKQQFHKLGQEQRARRVEDRGTSYIVSATKYYLCEQFHKYLPNIEKMVLHFPHAPNPINAMLNLEYRKHAVLGNGAVHGGWGKSYVFREWAFEQPYIEFVKHWIFDKSAASGEQYLKFLTEYAGVLALCGTIPVPKYSEIPMAGCVTFAERIKEYEELGFKDQEHCIYVNRDNFEIRVKDFLSGPSTYQGIADAGRKLMEDNYTADHFAEFIFSHVSNL